MGYNMVRRRLASDFSSAASRWLSKTITGGGEQVVEDGADAGLTQGADVRVGVVGRQHVVRPVDDGRQAGVKALQRAPGHAGVATPRTADERRPWSSWVMARCGRGVAPLTCCKSHRSDLEDIRLIPTERLETLFNRAA